MALFSKVQMNMFYTLKLQLRVYIQLYVVSN